SSRWFYWCSWLLVAAASSSSSRFEAVVRGGAADRQHRHRSRFRVVDRSGRDVPHVGGAGRGGGPVPPSGLNDDQVTGRGSIHQLADFRWKLLATGRRRRQQGASHTESTSKPDPRGG